MPAASYSVPRIDLRLVSVKSPLLYTFLVCKLGEVGAAFSFLATSSLFRALGTFASDEAKLFHFG
jgi:hypothetical protein